MNAVRRNPYFAAIWALILVLLILTACTGITATPSTLGEGTRLPLSTQANGPCETCAQATLAFAQTQEKNTADKQAAATADIVRANAQATLNSANATLSAAQVQDQNTASAIAAQIAIVRANAQATLNSAGSTQSAALAQDAIRQTQLADQATTDAEAVVIQKNKNDLAASTQTAVANNIATQTQVAAATSQWYADQSRQREEQRQKQGPLALVWMWCLPIFVVLFAGLCLWGFWRWMKIQQNNQRILEEPVDKLQAPSIEVIHHHVDDSLPYLESDIVDSRYQLTQPADQVHQWLDEVKDKLKSNDEKDENDNTTDN